MQQSLFDAPALAMWDAADIPHEQRHSSRVVTAGGDSRRTPITTTISADHLELVPDHTLLNNPDTVFPVIIDPAAANPARTNWLMVWSNGLTFRNSATENARVGYDGWQGYKTSRAFYQFDLAGLKGKNITSAVLTARQVHSPSYQCRTVTTNPGVQVYRTGSFTPTTTWSSQPTWAKLLATNTSENGNSTTCGGYLDQDWNVLVGVNDQLATSSTVVTFGMKSADETNKMGWRQYDNTSTYGAAFPKLVIEYYGYTTAPTNMAFTQADGNPLIQGHYIKTAGLKMTATITRPDGYTTAAAVFRIKDLTHPTNPLISTTGSPVTSPTGTSTTTLTLPADGPYEIWAQTCVLHNGSWTGCSVTNTPATITRDTTGPTTPTLTMEEALPNTLWTATITFSDPTVTGFDYEFLGGANGRVATPAGAQSATITNKWSTPQVTTLRVRTHDLLGNPSPWTEEVWIKISGPDTALTLHRYQLNGDGTDTGVQPANLKRHLTGSTTLNPNTHFPDIATIDDFCSPNTNQVFGPNGDQGVYMRANLTGTWVTDQPFAITTLIKPSTADITALQTSGNGAERVYTWGVSPNSEKTAYISLINDGGDIYWRGIINGITIPGSKIDDPGLGMPADRWYAIGLVLEAGKTPIMHIDNATFTAPDPAPNIPTAWIGIGSVSNNLPAFTGHIDEYTIWTNGLTPTNFRLWATQAMTC